MATIKKIVCPKCQAKLKFNPDKITSEVVKFKCPGCKTFIRVKKPDPNQDIPSSQIPSCSTQIEDITLMGQESKPSENHEKLYIKEKGTGEDAPADQPEEIKPAAESAIPEKPEEPLIEDYTRDKLAEYEEAEAGADDYEWTRYADKKEPTIPKTKIDLDLIPASDAELHEKIADLQQAEVYNLQGEANLGKNLVKQAIRDFNHALEINPDYVDALVNRGSAYVLQNNYNDALADLNHALDLEKKQAYIYKLRGEIYLLNKLYDESIKDFTAAIILNPIYSDAYLNRARAYSEKGMTEEAESDYNQAVRTEPEKFSSIIGLEGAETLFDEDESSKKETNAGFIQQGIEDLKNEKYYEAIENFTQAINLISNNAEVFILRGQAYLELNQPDEAMIDFNRAVISDPLNPALYYWRAMAWKALDSSINMVTDLKLACELGYGPACEEYEKLKPQKH